MAVVVAVDGVDVYVVKVVGASVCCVGVWQFLLLLLMVLMYMM